MDTSSNNINNPHFQASWNLAGQIIDSIASYLRTGGDNFLNGELDKYFWSLVLVKRRIYAFISPEEKVEADKIEKSLKAGVHVAKLKGYHTKPDFIENLEQYDALLMELMRKYGLLVPPKKDKSVMVA